MEVIVAKQWQTSEKSYCFEIIPSVNNFHRKTHQIQPVYILMSYIVSIPLATKAQDDVMVEH